MKKIGVSISVIFFVLGGIASVNARPITGIEEISARKREFLEHFLSRVSEGEERSVYDSLMSESFRASESFRDFTVLLSATGLKTFQSLQWTDQSSTAYGLLTRISCRLVDQDGKTHVLSFELVQANHSLMMGKISETFSMEDLKSKIPERAVAFVRKELRSLTQLIQSGQGRRLYQSLSRAAQLSESPDRIGSVIRALHAQNGAISIRLWKGLQLDGAVLLENGQLQTSGSYLNPDGQRIFFRCTYDYEWGWKLGGFSFEIKEGSVQ